MEQCKEWFDKLYPIICAHPYISGLVCLVGLGAIYKFYFKGRPAAIKFKVEQGGIKVEGEFTGTAATHENMNHLFKQVNKMLSREVSPITSSPTASSSTASSPTASSPTASSQTVSSPTASTPAATSIADVSPTASTPTASWYSRTFMLLIRNSTRLFL